MTTKEVAERFVELNRVNPEGSSQVYEELYSPEIVSIENWGDREEYQGMEALMEKGKQWESMLEEMHDYKISDPLVADKSFAVTHYMDVTMKEGGRMQMTELGTYWVNDEGKIVREEYCA
tara:strand:+ start:230 stop:589 length:360 start_codon:yes stop_codon:yes gene_type:complete